MLQRLLTQLPLSSRLKHEATRVELKIQSLKIAFERRNERGLKLLHHKNAFKINFRLIVTSKIILSHDEDDIKG